MQYKPGWGGTSTCSDNGAQELQELARKGWLLYWIEELANTKPQRKEYAPERQEQVTWRALTSSSKHLLLVSYFSSYVECLFQRVGAKAGC